MRVRAYQENEAFRKRRERALEILDKKVKPVKQEGEEGEEGSEVVTQKEYKGKPITREEVLELEYKALVSTGQTLYYRNEYHRAIEAFTKAINNNKEELGILIDRANCYIQVGNPKAALIDCNNVLKNHPDDTRAILAKAEAFFSMGEFEFALVFFERGLAIRSDLSAFKDGITKSTHAIEDSIKGEKPFEPNPNFAVSRPRKPLIKNPKKKTPLVVEDEDNVKPEDLLPEKVPALTMTSQEKSGFLGELALDYDYLVELREEVLAGSDDKYGEKEDKEILKIVNNALIYLEQRAQFWSQQGTPDTHAEATSKQPSPAKITSSRPVSSARRNPPKITKVTQGGARPVTPRKTDRTEQVPHYEMSKIQMYEAKFGKKRSQ
ncbi:TPR Domain containing protein [Tritrichomonas foetus]|uniref:Outer dynein arm-docking complex subunit 4 n=1 Tax=Tritrichomonas foetus TaxID=1144522 RepID=A0A1J4KI93_9EUKA|nr:TPR Domain containing protein [Tritrichomonas foetus]|eukprot:OHT09540.1 TPR Domain containing protein [Tritrichomonas foetus]